MPRVWASATRVLEGVESPKSSSDHAVIGGVVFVVGRRFEDGVEVDDRHAQVLQVIQLVDHALQVAAVEIEAVGAGAVGRHRADRRWAYSRSALPVGSERYDGAVQFIVEEAPGWWVVAGIAIAETVGEDLVHDAVLHPIGRLEGGIVHGQLPAVVRAVAKGLAPAAVAGVVVFVVGGGGAVNGDEAVPVNGRLGADGQLSLPTIRRCRRRQPGSC